MKAKQAAKKFLVLSLAIIMATSVFNWPKTVQAESANYLEVQFTDETGTKMDLTGDSDSATITYRDANSKDYPLNVILRNLPSTDTNKKVRITMASGLWLCDDGSKNEFLAPFIDGIDTENYDVIYDGYAPIKSVTYNLKQNSDTITIPAKLGADNEMGLSTEGGSGNISNAVKIEYISDQRTEVLNLENLTVTAGAKYISMRYDGGTRWVGRDITYDNQWNDPVTASSQDPEKYYSTYGDSATGRLYNNLTFRYEITDSNGQIVTDGVEMGGNILGQDIQNEGNGKWTVNFTNKKVPGWWYTNPTINFSSNRFDLFDYVDVKLYTEFEMYGGQTSNREINKWRFYFTDRVLPAVNLKSVQDYKKDKNEDYTHDDTRYTTSNEIGDKGVKLGAFSIQNSGYEQNDFQVDMKFDNTDIGVTYVDLSEVKGGVKNVKVTTSTGRTIELTETGAKNYSASVIGLGDGEYITDFSYTPTIPGVTRYWCTFGGEVLNYNNGNPEADSTIVMTYKDDKVDLTSNIGHMYTTTKGEKIGNFRLATYENITTQPGKSINRGFTYYNRGEEGREATTKNPNLYIRSQKGFTISNIKVTNVQGKDITSQCVITQSTFTDGTPVFKIDTSNVSGEDAWVYPGTPSKEKHEIKVAYTMAIPAGAEDGKYWHDVEYWAENTDDTKVSTHFGDTLGVVTGKEDKENKLVATIEANKYYEIKSKPEGILTNSAKNDSETEYSTWAGDDNYIQIGKDGKWQMKSNYFNNCSGSALKDSVIYQPIPKKGESWGDLGYSILRDGSKSDAFTWTGDMTGEINNPDSNLFTIKYGAINPAGDYSGIKAQNGDFKEAQDVADWSSINCVMIVVKENIPNKTGFDFIYDLKVGDIDKTEDLDGTIDVITPVSLMNMTGSDGLPYAKTVNGEPVALERTDGEIKGKLWVDTNHNGIIDAGETTVDGTEKGWEVVAYDKDGNEIGKSEVNSDGEYRIQSLPRKEGSVTLKVVNKDGGDTTFTNPNGDVLKDDRGFFTPNADHSEATYEGATAVIKAGEADVEGTRTFKGLGVYNIGIYNQKTKVKYQVEGLDETKGTLTVGTESNLKEKEVEGTPLENLPAVTPVPATGYSFDKWVYPDGTDATIREKFEYDATTYVARFREHNYKVKFNSNSGTGTMADESFTYSETKNLDSNTFTKPGYRFTGWNTSADGTGTAYTDSQAVSKLVSDDNGTIELFAQWEIDPDQIPVDRDRDGIPDEYIPANDPDKDGVYTDTDGKTPLVPEKDKEGKPVLDKNDNPVYTPAIPVDDDGDGVPDRYIPKDGPDENGVCKDEDGKTPLVPEKDKDGNPVLDKDGNQVYTPAIPVDDDGDREPDRYIPKDGPDEKGVCKDEDGKSPLVPEKDKDGNPVLDKDGNQVYTPAIPVDDDGDREPDRHIPQNDPDGDGIHEDLDGSKYVDTDKDGVYAKWLAAIALDPPVKKVVSGKYANTSKGNFSFYMEGKDGAPMPKEVVGKTKYDQVKNIITANRIGAGGIEFGDIEYTIDLVPYKGDSKTFTYVLGEINTGNSSYTYDKMVYTMTVTIFNNGDALVKEVSYKTADGKAINESNVTFVNVYNVQTIIPDTGDTTDILPLMYIMLISSIAVMITVSIQRKKAEEK